MARRSINDKLKDIEHMIPYKFHFDFGFHNTIKETYQHKSHYYDERPRDMDYKHEEYEIYDYMTGAGLLTGFADGYMESDKWKLFPTLELIVKYKHIIFKDGRKYILGKGVGRIEIIDLISLFRFLQTTKNYAIFNNLLNVMLIFIIDYNAEILNGKSVPSINLIDKYINKYYRWLYKERDNQIILVNSFIYEIEKKDIDYYSVAFNKKVIDYIASNWDKLFDELLKLFTQQRSSSLSPDKETQLSIKKRINIIKTLSKNLEYNMEINKKLIMSLQYQFIMDNIDDFPALKLDFQSKKLIYTSNKPMNEIHDVFEAIYYNKPSGCGINEINASYIMATDFRYRNTECYDYNDKFKKGLIPIYIKIYSEEEKKLYITYQIGEKYKRDKTPNLPLKMMLLNQLILFSNKQVLKELYNLAKKGADWLPPKGSSSSSLGSSGSPPKGGKQKKKK